jgi:hypothetical protein
VHHPCESMMILIGSELLPAVVERAWPRLSPICPWKIEKKKHDRDDVNDLLLLPCFSSCLLRTPSPKGYLISTTTYSDAYLYPRDIHHHHMSLVSCHNDVDCATCRRIDGFGLGDPNTPLNSDCLFRLQMTSSWP